MPGKASYSAHTPTANGPLPKSARKAVSNPPAAAVISKPRSATNACVLAQLRYSANANSGSAWIAWDSSIRSVPRRRTASSTRSNTGIGAILAVSHRLSSPTVPPVNDGRPDPDTLARRAAQFIAEGTGIAEHDVAIVLGSGWAPAVAALGPPTAVLPMADLPGFTPPTAVGHTGQVSSVRIGAHRVLVLAGRVHAYEGHDLLHVVHPVRAACAAGARVVVLTNAAGAVRQNFEVGQPVLISDHLNLTARSPLIGAQVVDMVDAYAPRLRALAREVDPTLAEGVYAGLPGPHYETPAEIRMLRTLGADLVGMSTVHETIAARAAGAEVLGVSLVTNLAAGITGEPLSHVDVLAAGAASATRMGTLLADVVARL